MVIQLTFSWRSTESCWNRCIAFAGLLWIFRFRSCCAYFCSFLMKTGNITRIAFVSLSLDSFCAFTLLTLFSDLLANSLCGLSTTMRSFANRLSTFWSLELLFRSNLINSSISDDNSNEWINKNKSSNLQNVNLFTLLEYTFDVHWILKLDFQIFP